MYKKIAISLFLCSVLIVIYAFADAFNNTDLEQAKSNVMSLIQQGNYAEAQVQTQKLLADFSGHEDIAKTVWEIAKKYDELKEYDKAFELNQYNIEHYYSDANAVLSQVEIVKFHFRKGDDAAVDASVDNFLTVFSGQPALPKGIYHIARRYNEFKRYDQAIELHQYNTEHFQDDIYALWSQMEIIEHHIRNKDDSAFESTFNNLVTVFAEQPTLPKEIWRIASMYDEIEEYDKALEINKYNIEHFPNDIHAMWSQIGTIYCYLRNQDDDGFDREFKKLYTIFAGQPALPAEIFNVAKTCDEMHEYDKAFGVNQYNIEHFPDRVEAMWSQVGIIYYHLRNGDYDNADSAADNLLTAFSGQTTLPKEIYLIADRFSLAGNHQRALELYQSLVDRETELVDINLRQYVVLSYFALTDIETAQVQLDKFITDFNNSQNLAEMLHDIAKKVYNKAMMLKAENGLDSNSINEFHKAMSIWSKAADDLPINQYTPKAYFCRAVVLSQELSQYADGIELFEYLINNHPDYKYAYHVQYQIGKYCERMLQDPNIPDEQKEQLEEKIEQAYQAVVEKYPDSKQSPYAALKLGQINFEKEQWPQAVTYFEFYLEKRPDQLRRVVLPLGQAYEKMGESEMAIELYQAFIETADPSDSLIETVKTKLETLEGQDK